MTTLTGAITIDTRAGAGNESAPGLTALAIILGAILLARIIALAVSVTDLHYQEARYWYWASEFAFGAYSGPPMIVWLLGLTNAVCGDSELCIRLPSPIIATATAFLVYALGLRLYNRNVAFWAALAYATLPAVSAFALVMTPEAPLAFFMMAGLLILSHHLEHPGLASGFLLGVVLGLGLNTGYAMLALPLCTALYLATTPTPSTRAALHAPGTALALLVAFVLILPTCLWQIGESGFALSSLGGLIRDRLDDLFDADATLLFVVLQFVLFGPILLFVLLRSVLARRATTPRSDADRFLLYHSVPILAALLAYAFVFGAKAHWTWLAFPAATLFVTALLFRHGFRRLFFVSTGIHVAILAGLLGLGVVADEKQIVGLDRLVGWHDFADGLAEVAATSEVKTLVLNGRDQVYQALYYLRGRGFEIRSFKPRGRATRDAFETARNWAYGDAEPVLLATGRDPSAFGIPLGAANKIGEFPVQSFLADEGLFSLYRVNPPSESSFP